MQARLVLLAALAFAVAPFLSPEFGGFDPNRFPVPQENPPIQPSGWAFAIWGVIYIGLVLHAVLGAFKYSGDQAWHKGRLYLLVSLVVGTAWLPVALNSPLLATLLIWVMLITALLALLRTQDAQPEWIAVWPVALYAGWLSAASFVSIGLVLAGYGIVTELPAAVIALAMATLFGTVIIFKLRQWPFGVALAWGFAGIAANNMGTNPVLSAVAFVTAAGILTLTAKLFVR